MSKKHRTFMRDDALVITDRKGKPQIAIGRDPVSDAKLRTVADLNQTDFAQVKTGLEKIAQRMAQFARNREVETAALRDAEQYGNGYLRVNPDGSLERIDPLRMLVTILPECEHRHYASKDGVMYCEDCGEVLK